VISTSAGPCLLHTKQIRYRSLIRIECCPARLPASFSSLFPGGMRRSLMLSAALSWRSFFCAARYMSIPRRGAFSRFQTRSVVSSAKDWIALSCYRDALVTSNVSILAATGLGPRQAPRYAVSHTCHTQETMASHGHSQKARRVRPGQQPPHCRLPTGRQATKATWQAGDGALEHRLKDDSGADRTC
jgi:hypothetical protein